ncbi:MAG: Iron-sulfur clusters incorporation protein [Heterodermia speciosa]|uniref:Iron-sulfur cluster assembly factor IBA57 homolog, mitochondrial n=1 Tax=Heterodermia speciosa TaxID=116794 RepID=A0A8H3EBT5_9LECA|nr:MAG: Iron-sulfur clusters incorporation protein [Heterodermia speciosa]
MSISPRTRPTIVRAFRSCRRLLSTSALPPAPPPRGYAHLTTRRLISLRGHDAPRFLQGLTTQNIPSVDSPSSHPRPQGLYSAFLNASGRVLYDVFIYPDSRLREQNDLGFLIDVDAREVQSLARHLKRYKLRAKVTVEVVDDGEAQVWQAWDDTSPVNFLPNADHVWTVCEDCRSEVMGTRLIASGDRKLDMDADLVDVGTYEVRRILRGVAEGQSEIIKDSALPLECNMDYMNGIDFRKGCYVGQELTIRTRHTGVVRKRILPVQLYGSGVAPEILEYRPSSSVVIPPKDTNINRSPGKGRSVGKWLGGIGNIGLALCRLENMTNIALNNRGIQQSPTDEFMLSWLTEEGREGGEVRTKAFVPDWLRTRISSQDTHGEGSPNG